MTAPVPSRLPGHEIHLRGLPGNRIAVTCSCSEDRPLVTWPLRVGDAIAVLEIQRDHEQEVLLKAQREHEPEIQREHEEEVNGDAGT